MLLIGVATLLIGLLPGYATVGVAAPIMLVLLRFAQGVGVGGEWGGAVLLSSEYGDPRKRGFWSSAAQIGPPAGSLLANGVLAVLAAVLTEDVRVLGLAGGVPDLRGAGRRSGCGSGSSWRTPRSSSP